MKKSFFSLLLLLAVQLDLSAGPVRKHYSLKDGNNVVVVTEISNVSEAAHTTQWLLSDADGSHFVVSESIDFSVQRSQYEIRELRHKTFLRASFDRPLKSKTRSESLSESAEPGSILSIKYETGDAVLFATELELADRDKVQSLTQKLRTTMDPHLLDAIERMSAIWSASPFAAVSAVLINPALRYRDCNQRQASEVRALPDCEFDASFGAEFHCSDASKEKIKAAVSSGKIITYY